MINGNLTRERDFQSENVYLGGVEWDIDGKKVFISASFMIGNKVDRNGVIVWNTENDSISRAIYIPRYTYLISVNPGGKSIVVMDYYFS
ncbi:hypothetical protein [Desulfosporosinus sp. OT]|uniref:hypothetical protein n=1 Tax=Desulfosporosinus sp. OT TaxID=913865 RepID=UPI0002DD8772|nr:hypothetical protein [Desulfosporosinus sp. OT]